MPGEALESNLWVTRSGQRYFNERPQCESRSPAESFRPIMTALCQSVSDKGNVSILRLCEVPEGNPKFPYFP